MLCAAMKLRMLLSLIAVPLLVAASGCGEESIEVAKSDPLYRGAEIFNQRCGGCHTYDAAGTEGSVAKGKATGREYKDGPNFNQRAEDYHDVLYAIQNGGFSSGPMPQNIVTGPDAKLVACFVATYSGKDRSTAPSPNGATAPVGAGADNCKQQFASTK
jgi:mono/diheme cytochrome c family protein